MSTPTAKTSDDAVRLAYDDQGEGPAVLLLHAFPFDRRFWIAITPALVKAGFRVISPDLRGFGESPRLTGTHAVADHARDVARFIETLGIAPAAVVGLSMGGYVALALAANHPRLVSALVLADTKAAADSDAARQGRDQAIELVNARGVAPFADGMLTRLVAPETPPDVMRSIRRLMNQPAQTVVATLAALRDRPDRRVDLPGILVPTLVIAGALDTLSTPEENRSMAEALPNAVLQQLPDVGHLPNLEHPASFAAALVAFLQRR